jgi:ribosomal protein S27E
MLRLFDSSSAGIIDVKDAICMHIPELSRPKLVVFAAEIVSVVGSSLIPKLSFVIVSLSDRENHGMNCIITGASDDLKACFGNICEGSLLMLTAPKVMVVSNRQQRECIMLASVEDAFTLSASAGAGSKRTRKEMVSSTSCMEESPVISNETKRFVSLSSDGSLQSWPCQLSSAFNVRKILSSTSHIERHIPLLVGLLCHVSIMEDDDRKQSSPVVKYAVVLRELRYPDIITVYVTVDHQINPPFLIGAIVFMRNVTFKAAENMRNIYGKMSLTRKTLNSSIGIIGFLPAHIHLPDVFQTSLQSKLKVSSVIARHINSLRKSATRYSEDYYCWQPPPTTIAQLEQGNIYDRCSWRIVGRLEYIKSIHINMRCSICFNQQTVGRHVSHHPRYCNRCGKSSICPMWEGKFIIDDGTSTGYLHCEGAVMIEMLRTICGAGNECLDEFIEAAESKVSISGYERYDTFHISRNLSSKANTFDDWFEADAADDASYMLGDQSRQASAEANLEAVHETKSSTAVVNSVQAIEYKSNLDPILDLFRKALTHPRVNTDRIQFVVQLIQRKLLNTSKDMQTRDIALQQWYEDPALRFMVSTTQVSSYAAEMLDFDCRHVQPLSSDNCQHIAFEALRREY